MTLEGEEDPDISEWKAYQDHLQSSIWASDGVGSVDLAKVNESLSKIKEELTSVKDRYLPPLVKASSSLKKINEEVVDESIKTTGTLSVAAQFLIEQDIEKAEADLRDIVSDHRSVHTAISKSGKDIDRYLGKNLSGLFKGQKNLDDGKDLREVTCKFICKHIHTSGYCKSSAALVKDANLKEQLQEQPDDRMDVERLNYQLKEESLAKLTRWVMKNDEGNFALRCDIDKLKVIKMIKKGDKMKAIGFIKNKTKTGLDVDREFMSIIMSAFVKTESKPFLKKKLPIMLDSLQKRIMYALTFEQCLLPYLLDIGIMSIPNLMHIRQHIDKRPEFMFSGEEFPMALYSECDGHCTVNCPILRQQVTKENPAVRISCGHVMSRDAVTKLSAQSSFRGVNRIKCPYCPSECTLETSQELYF